MQIYDNLNQWKKSTAIHLMVGIIKTALMLCMATQKTGGKWEIAFMVIYKPIQQEIRDEAKMRRKLMEVFYM